MFRVRRRSCFGLNLLVLAAKFPNHAQITLASKMATIVPTSYRKTAKKCPDVSVEILVFVGRRQLQNVLTFS